ncbi:MAG TPA: ABC-F family ATP-binding cassette domain-containing protein [Saprospiraceae bacterium]|nr:ABC-F family ATP-binding cassette domain-containing protein [Saprospiraceae bacterium]
MAHLGVAHCPNCLKNSTFNPVYEPLVGIPLTFPTFAPAMLLVKDINTKFGDRTLLDNVTFSLRMGEKVGLIGRNGTGKSTLLKIIAGLNEADSGLIDRPASMAYLKQEISIDPDLTVMEAAYAAFDRVKEINEEIEHTTHGLTHSTDDDHIMHLSQRISELYAELDHLGAGTIEGDIQKVLKGLGFDEEVFDKPVGQLSGGWQMRVELAKLLLGRPDYLLLDEPTNHLDMPSIIWLEKYLKSSEAGILLVSHDKRFLDQLTNRTIEISLGRLYDMPLPYSAFMEERQKYKEIQLASYQNQQKNIERTEKLIDRFRAKASKASMAKSLEKQLEKVEVIELEEEDNSAMKIKFPVLDRAPRTMIHAKNLSKNYGPKEVLRNVEFDLERNEKVAFVGQNGQGKSTLAKMIGGRTPPTEGLLEVNERVLMGYYAQDQTELFDGTKTVLHTIEALAAPEVRPRVRAILGAFLFSGEDSGKKVSVLSGGERARLALACMILSQTNLLIMDEPTHHLDIQAKQRLKDALMDYPGALIIISHDRDFLTGLTSRTLEFAGGQIKEYIGDIDEMLSKKGIENLDALSQAAALKTKTASETKVANVPEAKPVQTSTLSDQEKKNLQRRFGIVEKEISACEQFIKEKEVVLADPEFYQSPGFQKEVNSYEAKKTELERLMIEWEELAGKLAG